MLRFAKILVKYFPTREKTIKRITLRPYAFKYKCLQEIKNA